MATATKINVRIDEELKKNAQKTLNEFGLDLSSGIKLFLHTVVNSQSIPFEIRTKNGYTVAQEKEIIEEMEETLRLYKEGKVKAYDSIDKLHEDIFADETI